MKLLNSSYGSARSFMGVGIEWKVGILRIGKDFKHYGDPYEFSCVVTQVDSILFMEGGSSGSKNCVEINRKEIKDLLLKEGIKSVEFTKRTKGKERKFKRNL
jgi:hypothetical protein